MSGVISAALIGGGAAIYGASQSRRAGQQQAQAATQAADTQAEAMREGMASQERMFERQNQLNEPFRQAGMTGQNRYMELMGLGGNTGAQGYGRYARDFGMSDFQQDPGYEFRLTEGLKVLDRQAAARGGLISGAALKAAGRYGQDYASGEFQNAFNRYQINRSNQLNPLAALAGMGQTATGAMSNAAGNFGNNMYTAYSAMGGARAGGMTDAAAASAAGRMGGTNALMGGIGQGMNFYQNNRLMDMYANNMYNRRGGAAPIENRTLPYISDDPYANIG